MRVRRCAVLYLEPREDTAFELASLLAGGDGLARTQRWLALAPHLGEEVEVDAGERELLGALSPERWVSTNELSAESRSTLRRLLKAGLAIGSTRAHAAHRNRDERLRGVHWHPLAAALHAFTRWSDADAVKNMQDSHTETASDMREVLGAPPPEAAATGDVGARIPLARIPGNDFDALLARRATCRNFDPARKLPQELFAQLMQRVFAAQAEVRVGGDTAFLKKNSPSGGGLHPTEAYLLVQHVEGIAPGLYHYHATAHALEPLPSPELPLREFLMQAVAQQHWFADAHVAVALVPRFDRTFWKYRRHMKGYRVVAGGRAPVADPVSRRDRCRARRLHHRRDQREADRGRARPRPVARRRTRDLRLWLARREDGDDRTRPERRGLGAGGKLSPAVHS